MGPLLQPVCSPAFLARVLQQIQRYEYLRAFTNHFAWSRIDSTLTVSGACAAYRRDVINGGGRVRPQKLGRGLRTNVLMFRIHRYC